MMAAFPLEPGRPSDSVFPTSSMRHPVVSFLTIQFRLSSLPSHIEYCICQSTSLVANCNIDKVHRVYTIAPVAWLVIKSLRGVDSLTTLSRASGVLAPATKILAASSSLFHLRPLSHVSSNLQAIIIEV